MIKKLIRQMLAAQVLSALTVSLCLLIDNIMIGRYLGLKALAAYGLANPVLLIIGALGSMLSAGVQVACSRSLGRGSQQETNAGYSTALLLTAAVSAALVALVLLLRGPLARALGAGEDAELFENTRSYMTGFIIGAPASMGALILVPFLQMAGRNGLLIAAVLGMTVTDVVLDVANVLVFRGGMFGMGLASSLSYYVAMLVGGSYFIRPDCVFRFSRSLASLKKVRELLAGGVPTVFTMASSVVLIFAMNRILLPVGGDAAVAAFTVIITLGNASNCISTGMGGVALTLSGILYNEEDRTGLRSLPGLLVCRAVGLGLAMTAALVVLAPWCVALFIPQAGQSQAMAVTGLRLYALGLTPCCVNSALKNCYQGVGRVKTTEVISVLENALLPVLSALALRLAAGLGGIWHFYVCGELLTLAGIVLQVWLIRGRISLRGEDILLLPERFGVPPQDLLEADVGDMADVLAVSRAAEAFCSSHGRDRRLAGHLAICVEELGGNIVTHGFRPGGGNHLLIRLQYKDGRWVLRFRDDCAAFDPVRFMREGEKGGMGIPLAMHMADEASYTCSMNLNNLMLVLYEK